MTDTAQTRQLWNHHFKIEMIYHLGQTLNIEMRVHNLDTHAFQFTFAWHSYFNISHIQQIQIDGLQHIPCIDQLHSSTEQFIEDHVITFDRETDRIYPQTSGQFVIYDQTNAIHIQSKNCPSAVVWNPWIEKSKRLGDVAEQDWQNFVCLECGQIGQTVQLHAREMCVYHLNLFVRTKNH